MHLYSQNILNKRTVYFYLAAASIFLWLVFFSPILDWPFSTASAIYLALWLLLDQFLWKLIPNRYYPDISGSYNGMLEFDDSPNRPSTTIEFRIEQTFSRILVSASTDRLSSRSSVAGLVADGENGYALEYGYGGTFTQKIKIQAAKKGSSPVQDHLGFGVLRFQKSDMKTLEGIYFTAPPLSSSGTLLLTKQGIA